MGAALEVAVGVGSLVERNTRSTTGRNRCSAIARFIAFPDCFTRLGGNQYVNSASTGAWEDFLPLEMLPAIEQRFGCGGAIPAAMRRCHLHRWVALRLLYIRIVAA